MILPIEKERIPYRFEVGIMEEVFTFEIHYNGEHNFFTIDLLRNDEVIIYGEKIVYGQPLFNSLSDTRLPKLPITPLDLSGEHDYIDYSNFTETILLYVGDVNG